MRESFDGANDWHEFVVTDLEACEPTALPFCPGIRVEFTGEKSAGSSGCPLVNVYADTVEELLAFVRLGWGGDDDPDWFREQVVDRVEKISDGDYDPTDIPDTMSGERVEVTLLAVNADKVDARIPLDEIAEQVVEAAFTAAHEGLQKVEGHRRYGDVMPGEVFGMERLAKLVVRSVLVNGEMSLPPSAAMVEKAVARAKTEILADIAAGRVPATVASFSELHDFVDANEYGGLCDDGMDALNLGGEEAWMKFGNDVQGAVDAWIKQGGHRAQPRQVLIHLNASAPADDPRSADEIGDAVLAAVERGLASDSDGLLPSLASGDSSHVLGLDISAPLVEEV